MLLTYLGTLKTWIYAPVVRLWLPSAYSVRFPMIAAGAVTVWLFYCLLVRLLGRREALIGAALLATDTSYVLTTTFDWGPVALQHLTVVAGALLLVRFHQTGSQLALSLGFFFFGLGLWDKALFLWTLGGLVVATAIVLPRILRRAIKLRNIATAAMAFCLGALPLLVYNAAPLWVTPRLPRFQTFNSNSSLSLSRDIVLTKFAVLRATLNGSAVFGYVAAEDDETALPREPRSMSERASIALSRATGRPRENWMGIALLVAILALPAIWFTPARKPALFSLAVMVTAWLLMAATNNAGGGAHHAVLLWPFPHMLIAVLAGGLSRRLPGRPGPVAAAAAVALLSAGNLTVWNQYRAQLIRNGGHGAWTDAIYPLATFLRGSQFGQVWTADWGIFDSLALLGQGTLPLGVGSEPGMKPEPEDADRDLMRRIIEYRDAVFVGHTAGRQEFTDINDRMVKVAAQVGYRKELLRTVADGNGRPVFEVYRFVPAAGSADLSR